MSMIQKKGWNLIPHWFNREGPGAGVFWILLSDGMPDSIWRRYSWITPIRRYARSIRISFFDFSAYLSIGEFNIASEFSLVNEKLTFAAYDKIGGEASRCGALFLCLIRIIKSACVERVSWLVRVLQNTAISIKKIIEELKRKPSDQSIQNTALSWNLVKK